MWKPTDLRGGCCPEREISACDGRRPGPPLFTGLKQIATKFWPEILLWAVTSFAHLLPRRLASRVDIRENKNTQTRLGEGFCGFHSCDKRAAEVPSPGEEK